MSNKIDQSFKQKSEVNFHSPCTKHKFISFVGSTLDPSNSPKWGWGSPGFFFSLFRGAQDSKSERSIKFRPGHISA